MKLDTFRHTCDIGHHIQIRIMADSILGALLASDSPKYMKEKYWSIGVVVVVLFVSHYGGKTPSRNSLREKVLFTLTFCLFYFLILKLKCNHIISPFSSLPPTPPIYSPCPPPIYDLFSSIIIVTHMYTQCVYFDHWVLDNQFLEKIISPPLIVCTEGINVCTCTHLETHVH